MMDVGDDQVRQGLLPQPHPANAGRRGDDGVAGLHEAQLNAPTNGPAHSGYVDTKAVRRDGLER
jgi:hypothetical protein